MLVYLTLDELTLVTDLLQMEIHEADGIIAEIADDNEDIEEMLSEAGNMVDLKVDIVRLHNKLQEVLTQPQGIIDV